MVGTSGPADRRPAQRAGGGDLTNRAQTQHSRHQPQSNSPDFAEEPKREIADCLRSGHKYEAAKRFCYFAAGVVSVGFGPSRRCSGMARAAIQAAHSAVKANTLGPPRRACDRVATAIVPEGR